MCKKRLLGILLVVVIVLAIMPSNGFASGESWQSATKLTVGKYS